MPDLNLVPEHVLRKLLLELLDEVRPLGPRPDQGHVALQDVPDLRQFVHVEPAQEPPDRGAPRVVLARATPGPVSRSASMNIDRNLYTAERPAVEAHALLPVEDGTRAT